MVLVLLAYKQVGVRRLIPNRLVPGLEDGKFAHSMNFFGRIAELLGIPWHSLAQSGVVRVSRT